MKTLQERTLELFLRQVESDANAIMAITENKESPESATIRMLDKILKIDK